MSEFIFGHCPRCKEFVVLPVAEAAAWAREHIHEGTLGVATPAPPSIPPTDESEEEQHHFEHLEPDS